MKLSSWKIFSFIVGVIAVITLSASASESSEIFVVSATLTGDATYFSGNGDGTFSTQESLPLASENGISGNSYGNGIGDFDNDGDLDYIMGTGIDAGEIYVFEKLGPGNQFGPPVPVASWTDGFFPMDMAVADFDEDGNLDFVMSYLYSNNCAIYLGDGKFGFVGPEPDDDTDPLLLANAAEFFSAGADAADFNNDGHADFIIAPYSTNGKFHVHLGNGDGTFQSDTFDSHAGAAYYGTASADFDNDGSIDIAASYAGYIDIYLGNNDGTFKFDYRMVDDALTLSSIDNYDFNNDGNQDLIAANIGSDGDGVAVYLGNGDGSFAYLDTFSGGSPGQHYAISAPPAEANKEPVAVVSPVYLEAFVGDEIVVDGSQSYDEDGEIVSFDWDFGDAQTAAMLQTLTLTSDTDGDTDDVSPTHIYYEAGNYTIQLTVTDNKGATASVLAEVHVSEMPVLEVNVGFYPSILNLKSKDKWIWATLRPPAGNDARKIDDASVCIVFENAPPIYARQDYGHGFFAKIRKSLFRKKSALTVKFDRQAVINNFGNISGNKTLNVEGMMLGEESGIKIAGSGTIRTIVMKKKKSHFCKLRKPQTKRIMNHLAKKRGSYIRKQYWH
jgi:hypothetical protein